VKILIDMNLTPDWVGVLAGHGWHSVHWSSIGDPRATDWEILSWASDHGYVVFTHDLDFGALLALTQSARPSVIQVRARDVLPSHLGDIVARALRQHERELQAGALVVVDEIRSKIRILPIKRAT
jgi:predicted nuclease of predicted toxin-antitoxin system